MGIALGDPLGCSLMYGLSLKHDLLFQAMYILTTLYKCLYQYSTFCTAIYIWCDIVESSDCVDQMQ